MDPVIIKIFLVLCAVSAIAGYQYFFPAAPDDNPIEELAEDIIKNATGLDIDVTPKSPEDKK